MRKNVYFHYALLLLVIIVSCSHLTVVIHYVNCASIFALFAENIDYSHIVHPSSVECTYYFFY